MSYGKSKELLVGLTALSMPGERQRLEFHKNRECMYLKIEWKNIYAPKTPVKSRRDQQLQIIWISKPQNHVKEGIIIDDGNKR